ncbi:hypothetical protein KY328_06015 [Candidatus Woesearchaeota archaeon]|nr:hypothetical protein [Candidatus Woesearchaeota archaeon]MBW3022456.1 hypothetical protein [Candidatus Woesearchaeota archaeon]
MEKVKTQDGSVTFMSDKVGETYHSISGAKEESEKKFVEPCLGSVKDKDDIWVLDVCFGLGYNTAALLDAVTGKRVNVIALENDPGILLKILEVDDVFDSHFVIKDLIKENKNKIIEIKNIKENKIIKIAKENITITLIVGDALSTIKTIKECFDICFLDPFSPKKVPELWTYELFKDIYGRMNVNGMLTTYSCARIVRDNLEKAGFIVKDGPCVGRKAPATVAVKGMKQAAPKLRPANL